MADEVEIHRGEATDRVAQVPGQGQGLEEHLGQDHGGSDVEEHPALQGRDEGRRGQ